MLKNKIKNGFRYILDPSFRFLENAKWGMYNNVPDDVFLKKAFKLFLGYELNLENPKTFNEKMQYLKIHNRQDVFTTMVDKYLVKDYVSKKIGEQYVIPLLGVWDKFEDIDFNKLPDQFVLKSTHDSGSIVICTDKEKINKESAKQMFEKSLKRQYYYTWREWPYKNVKPRIIAEKYMKDRNSENLNVFKFLNFNGNPEIVQVIQDDKTDKESIDYFNTKWEKIQITQGFPNSEHSLSKPETLDTMLKLAEKLSEGFPFLRTDFYEINGKVYFSEFTFFSDTGLGKFDPPEWDLKLGKMIDLSLLDKPRQ